MAKKTSFTLLLMIPLGIITSFNCSMASRKSSRFMETGHERWVWESGEKVALELCTPSTVHFKKCVLVTNIKLNWTEAHSYCRGMGGFLPMEEEMKQVPESSEDEVWTALAYVEGQYQWLTRSPAFARYVSWEDRGPIPEPRSSQCAIYNRQKKKFTASECQRELSVYCIVDKVQERDPSNKIELRVSSNLPAKSNWIEVPKNNFNNLILKCIHNALPAKNKEKANRRQEGLFWKKDGIYLGHNSSMIHPTSNDDPSKSSLFPHEPPDGYFEAIQQGTYCCETWNPYSATTTSSGCILVTLSNTTTLIISAVTNQQESVEKVLSYFEPFNSTWFKNMPLAHIRSNELVGKGTKFEYKFHLHVQNIPLIEIINFIDELSKFLENQGNFNEESNIVFATYCFEKKITLDFGNEIDLPFAKAGHSYITDFKCKTKNNYLAYNVCHWNFTDGAWVSLLDSNTCIRYDICPNGYTIIGGQLCAKIIKNVNWNVGYSRLYQTRNDATLFDDDLYFSDTRSFKNSVLHEQVRDYLQAQNISKLWLPFKRKYQFTPFIDYSIRNYKKSHRNILHNTPNVAIEWAINHPMGNKSCLAFNTAKSTLFTDECQKKLNIIKLVNIMEFGPTSLLSDNINYNPILLCPDGWDRIVLNATEHLCLKVFRDLSRPSWSAARSLCTSKKATLANPGKSFLNWVIQALLQDNETAWTVLSKDNIHSLASRFDYLNWLPETNYSKGYGVISRSGWSMADDHGQRSHSVICEKKVATMNKHLKLKLEPLKNDSDKVLRKICVRAEPQNLFKNQSITCLKNGVVEELLCQKRSECLCTLEIDRQGYYECFAWLEWPLNQVWSPYFKYIDDTLTTYAITGIEIKKSYIPLSHDSTFIERKKLSKLDSHCMTVIYNQLSNEDRHVELSQILYANNDEQLQFSFHLQCKNVISSFCNKAALIRGKLEAMINDSKSCSVLEVRNTVGCDEEITDISNGKKLTWSSVEGSGRFLPNELCIATDGHPVNRLCEGNFLTGYIWSTAPHTCPTEPSKHTEGLWNIYNDPRGYLNGNYSTSIAKLTKDSDSLTVADYLFVASSLQSFAKDYSDNEKLRFPDVVSTMNNMMGVKESIISTVNEKFIPTSQLLMNFEKLSFLTSANTDDALKISTERLSVGCVDFLKGPFIIGFQSGGLNTDSKLLSGIEELDETYVEAAILLPKVILQNQLLNLSRIADSKINSSKLLFVVYKNANLFNDTSKDIELVSQVVQASIENVHVKNLKDKGVKVLFRPKYAIGDIDPQCVFWDFERNEGKGGWSNEGCKMTEKRRHLVSCECNHLTSFALLMNYDTSHNLAPIHTYFLGTISTVGCSLSIFGLVLVLATFLVFEKFRKSDDNKILANLSFAILMSMLIFLAGIQQTWNAILCRAVAVSLHYFILASFCWMLVEAIHQYFKFVKVCGYYIPRFIWKAFIFGWGTPFVPIMAILTVNSDLYYNDYIVNICWISSSAFLYSFVPPVAFILVINTVIYAMIINGAIISKSKLSSNQDQKQLIISQISMAICVFFLLGFTWIFGFLTFSEDTVIFSYLFCIFNTSQGFFIFFFHLFRNRNARKLWVSFFDTSQSNHSRKFTTSQYSNSSDATRTLSKRLRRQSNKTLGKHPNISLTESTASSQK